MWLNAVVALCCAAVAGALGWRCLHASGLSPKWWWAYAVGVAAGTYVVGLSSHGAQSLPLMWFTAAALVLAAVDALLLRLPNVLVYPTVVVVGAGLTAVAVATSQAHVGLRVVVAGIGAGVGYLVLHLISPQGLGMGDVKFAPAVAMAMGWDSWGWVAISTLGAFLLAGVWGIAVLVWRRGVTDIPFGPFMVAGAAITPVVGDPLLWWWLST